MICFYLWRILILQKKTAQPYMLFLVLNFLRLINISPRTGQNSQSEQGLEMPHSLTNLPLDIKSSIFKKAICTDQFRFQEGLWPSSLNKGELRQIVKNFATYKEGKIEPMYMLADSFLKLQSDDGILHHTWHTMLLLSYFNPLQEQEFIKLHSEPKHNDFLIKLVMFHVETLGNHRGGRALKKNKFISLSDLLSARIIPHWCTGLTNYYQYYDRILHCGYFSACIILSDDTFQLNHSNGLKQRSLTRSN